jgi:hypothetical protein
MTRTLPANTAFNVFNKDITFPPVQGSESSVARETQNIQFGPQNYSNVTDNL